LFNDERSDFETFSKSSLALIKYTEKQDIEKLKWLEEDQAKLLLAPLSGACANTT